MRFSNDGAKIVDKYDVLNIKCIDEREAEKLVDYLNDQNSMIINAGRMNGVLKDKYDKGYDYS